MPDRRPACLSLLLLHLLPGCALTAGSDLSIIGHPESQYTEEATIRTVFLNPPGVAVICMGAQVRFGKMPMPVHACTFADPGGPITMVLPVPGSLPDDVYGALVAHEYQHVGQLAQGKPVGHHGWR